MSEQPHSTFDIAVVIVVTLPTTHGTEAVGTHGPGKSRHEKMRHARTINTCTKQGLSATVTVIPNSHLVATDRLRILWRVVWIVGAEPGSHLKS